MKKMNYAVLGCGNGAQAVAGFLALRGNNVSIVGYDPQDIGKINCIKETGGIELIGAVKGFGTISSENATVNIERGVEGRDVILLVVPAFAQVNFFTKMLGHLKKGQIVVIIPGDFGSLRLLRMLKEAGQEIRSKQENIIIAETSSLPFACRLVNHSKVEILGVKDSNSIPLSTIPAHETSTVIGLLKGSFFNFAAEDNVLKVSLNNINFPMHPIISLFSMARIEYCKGKFNFYGEGVTPSVTKIMEEIDLERINVGSALGFKLPNLFYLISSMYKSSLKGDNLCDMLSQSVVHTKTGGPDSLKHRYITEDVAYGLVPITSLGIQLGVECKGINAIIHLFSIATGIDFIKEGMTVEKLGLSGLSPEEIINYSRTGARR